MSEQTPYLYINCPPFGLLLATKNIVEVIDIEQHTDVITWRDKNLNIIDLTAILHSSGQVSKNHNAIIIEDNNLHRAIAVQSVAKIKAIAEQDFKPLPSLDFSFNRYFDRAYLDNEEKQCIYRLKLDAFLQADIE